MHILNNLNKIKKKNRSKKSKIDIYCNIAHSSDVKDLI